MQHKFALPALSVVRSRKRPLGYLLFCVCQLFYSCQKEPPKRPEIAGYYQMESLQTDLAVDLDNDGISSMDAMAQISQVNFISQYNFKAPNTYMEIRPTENQTVYLQHLYVPFPHPRITFEYTNSPNGRVSYLSNGLNAFGYGYRYDRKTKAIHLDRSQVQECNEKQWGKLVDIKVLDQDRLQLLVSKDYYDFSQAGWIRLQLTAVYRKVSQ
jgi:hypothetical protein